LGRHIMPLLSPRSLSDLIRGIRSSEKKNLPEFISKAIGEVKKEIAEQSHAVKAEALLKLVYLWMLGYDMSWANFHVVEVMAMPKFAHKRIGFFSAAHSFTQNTEVLLLTTNLFKKDFFSVNPLVVGMALNCLSNICNADLAADCISDVVGLLDHGHPYVRKRATIALFQLFVKYPDGLRPAFPKLREKLEDSDPAVVSSAVNVVCELARRNPKNYLPLAPTFFRLLTEPANNWQLIKVIKLLASLTPHEPRLAKKLVQPITNLITSSKALSVVYECVRTVSIGMRHIKKVVKVCADKLSDFIQHADQNIKYLGLLSLHDLSEDYPELVNDHRDTILDCLDDNDITIQRRALDLVDRMVDQNSLVEVVRLLVEHIIANDGEFRSELISRVVKLCSEGNYARVQDFEWYVAELCDLAHFRDIGRSNGEAIAAQLVEVMLRVPDVREFAVEKMESLVMDPSLSRTADADSSMPVIEAAAWICGEYSEFVGDKVARAQDFLEKRLHSVAPSVQATMLCSAFKLYAAAKKQEDNGDGVVATSEEDPVLADTDDALASFLGDSTPAAAATKESLVSAEKSGLANLENLLKQCLSQYSGSSHSEVEEMSCMLLSILELVQSVSSSEREGLLQAPFSPTLKPINPKAQRKVVPLDGFDLDAEINSDALYDFMRDEEEPQVSIEEAAAASHQEGSEEVGKRKKKEKKEKKEKKTKKKKDLDAYYIGGKKSAEADEGAVAVAEGLEGMEASFGVRKPKKKVYKIVEEEEPTGGATGSGDEKDEISKKLDIDLSKPLDGTERLPTLEQYRATGASKSAKADAADDGEKVVKKKKKKVKAAAAEEAQPDLLGGVLGGEEGGAGVEKAVKKTKKKAKAAEGDGEAAAKPKKKSTKKKQAAEGTIENLLDL